MANKAKKIDTGIEVKRKDNESVGSLSRRFVQKVRRSGVLYEVRQRQYVSPKKNKRARKDSALIRAKRKKEYEKARKWGKFIK
ncbi:MAG: hypothetical protein R3346_02885 [Candidatus Spechtbacterales bacterium]|nr:hypothetical protein [Candidatus Spechtbacterales bacterium]